MAIVTFLWHGDLIFLAGRIGLTCDMLGYGRISNHQAVLCNACRRHIKDHCAAVCGTWIIFTVHLGRLIQLIHA